LINIDWAWGMGNLEWPNGRMAEWPNWAWGMGHGAWGMENIL